MKFQFVTIIPVVISALIILAPVAAQQTTSTTSTENCQGAQVWYNSLENTTIESYVTTALLPTNSMVTKKVKAVEAISAYADKVEGEATPDCLATPKMWYVASLRIVADTLTTMLDKQLNISKFVFEWGRAQEIIGQFRGYMMAIGVKIIEPQISVITINTDYTNLMIWK